MLLFFKKKECGTVSLEACIALPIFIFILMFFYGLIVAFAGQQMMCHSLIQSAESLALDPYSAEKITLFFNTDDVGGAILNMLPTSGTGETMIQDSGDLFESIFGKIFASNSSKYFSSSVKWYDEDSHITNYPDDMIETVKNRFIGFIAGGGGNDGAIVDRADSRLKELGVKDGLKGLDFSETKIEGDTLTITIKYKQEFIFNFQGVAAFDRKQSVCVNLWK